MVMRASHDAYLRRRNGRNPIKNTAARIVPECNQFGVGINELVMAVVETVSVAFRVVDADTFACCGFREHVGGLIALPAP